MPSILIILLFFVSGRFCNKHNYYDLDESGECFECDLHTNAEDGCATHTTCYFSNKLETQDQSRCISAYGKFNETSRIFKKCVPKIKAEDWCTFLKEEGYNKCIICNTHLCNSAIDCYECDSQVPSDFNCVLSVRHCTEDHSCFSTKGMLNGKPIIRKGCVDNSKSAKFCQKYKTMGSSCSLCHSNLCNGETPPMSYRSKTDYVNTANYIHFGIFPIILLHIGIWSLA